MRKVTVATCSAFEANNQITMSNTYVTVENYLSLDELANKVQVTSLYLHNNLIARKRYESGVLISFEITNAGWQSSTTKERLNGLNGVSIFQKKGQWYLNGKKWDGGWVNVNKWNAEK